MFKIYIVAVLLQIVLSVIANQMPDRYSCHYKPEELSVLQYKIYSGEATLKERFSMVAVSIFSCLVFPPTHIIAVVLAFIFK